jgi:hypothetical protein
MSQTVEQLVSRFLEATVEKTGTDEEMVYEILTEVNDRCLRPEFEKTVYRQLNRDERKDFLFMGEKYAVPLILADEFSGFEFLKAMDRLDGSPGADVGLLESIGFFLSQGPSLSKVFTLGSYISGSGSVVEERIEQSVSVREAMFGRCHGGSESVPATPDLSEQGPPPLFVGPVEPHHLEHGHFLPTAGPIFVGQMTFYEDFQSQIAQYLRQSEEEAAR